MSEEHAHSPTRTLKRGVKSAWNSLLTIYYANTVSWRVLKSGALFFLGFFMWAGSNILLAYFPGLVFLHLTRSYGFVLILYGPFHHVVVIPIYQRLRRQGTNLSLAPHLHLPNISLGVFLVLVLVLTAFPLGPVAIDFQAGFSGGGADTSPQLSCIKGGTESDAVKVHCHLSDSKTVKKVVVKSGDKTLFVDTEPPFAFTIRADDIQALTGTKRFRVNLLAEDGSLIRRFSRTLPMIDKE